MRILENTVSVKLEIWDDPGDYPNGLASGPLTSCYQLEDIEGHLIIQVEQSDREMDDWYEQGKDINLYAMMESHRISIDGIKITEWQTHPEMDEQDFLSIDVWKIIPYKWDDSRFSP